MKVRVEVKLSRYGTNMEDAVVVEWLKAPGDEVAKGDPLCEVETEKVAAALEATATGTLVEIVTEVGSVVEVGAVMCLIETEAA
jgi:pyruvate/2-oxoglutarate dehydrogenase complex dihydrolipoamide acyltransferase (E2) component